MRVSTGRQHAVDEAQADAAALVTEVQPGHGAGAVRSLVGVGGRIDGVELLGLEELGAADVKGGDAVGVEEVVAEEGDGRAEAVELEGSAGGEGVAAAAVEVQGHLVGVEGGDGQGGPGGHVERGRGLVRVELGDVVEHGEGAGGEGVGAGGCARVVLHAEAEGDVLEGDIARRGGKFFDCWRCLVSTMVGLFHECEKGVFV